MGDQARTIRIPMHMSEMIDKLYAALVQHVGAQTSSRQTGSVVDRLRRRIERYESRGAFTLARWSRPSDS